MPDQTSEPRSNPLLPYVFYELKLVGKTWRVLLQVSEAFHRISEEQQGLIQEDFYPIIVKFLGNAGRFPEVNRVSLLDDSNTFAIRLNLTWAYNQESAIETVNSIKEKLDVYLEAGQIDALVPRFDESSALIPDEELLGKTSHRSFPDTVEDEEPEEVPETAFSAFLEFLNEPETEWNVSDLSFLLGEETDDDDDDSSDRGLPEPI